jgi:hypothetical protein
MRGAGAFTPARRWPIVHRARTINDEAATLSLEHAINLRATGFDQFGQAGFANALAFISSLSCQATTRVIASAWPVRGYLPRRGIHQASIPNADSSLLRSFHHLLHARIVVHIATKRLSAGASFG